MGGSGVQRRASRGIACEVSREVRTDEAALRQQKDQGDTGKAVTTGTKKALFHGFMALAAALEYRSAKQGWRKHLCGAWLGFHVACVVDDLTEKPQDVGELVESFEVGYAL